tara:strand:+ start:376 stop:1644 length:1269 start_codon:yes stop_codon:yes gene_type:complete
MGSVFTTSKNVKTKKPFGGFSNTPFYLQFVPGVVVDVITHPTAFNSYNKFENLGSIIALPHIQEGTKKKKSNLTDSDRYFPLMRGIVDVPAKGDPILLCTIGGIKYYLGPLNTKNHPNHNMDNLYSPEYAFDSKRDSVETDGLTARGESKNFKKKDFRRLAKIPNQELDNGDNFNETHGDLLLEGRHGNSIRVGSRDINPYIMLSNGRTERAIKESLSDGSLLSITENGTLHQHYGDYIREVSSEASLEQHDVELEGEEIIGFTLASDLVYQDDEPPARFMGSLVSSINNDQDTQELIYGWNKNQMLLHSDRITLNSKLDDVYLSSNKDIHIGSKRHVSISTGKNLIIESEKTYLGDPNKKTMDNMVLGKKLQNVLKDIVALFKEIKVPTQIGPQASMPLPSEPTVMSAIDEILSDKHFLEE